MLCVLSLSLMVSAAEHHEGIKEVGTFWKLVHICLFSLNMHGPIE